MKQRSWIAAALVVLGVGGAGVWWWQRDAAPAATYRTAKIERGALTAAVSSSGTVNPVSQVSVGSQVSGQIKEMLADFNTEVKKGQLIARIDPESFEYKVRQASADVEAARASVLNAQANVAAVMANVSKARLDADNAQRDLVRKQDLLARSFISQADFENTRNVASTLAEALKVAQAQAEVARAQVGSAQAVVRQREAALAQAKVDLERTEIRSPVDGVVIKRSVDVGQTVAASLQAPELFIIARNLQDMQVEASIDEADISRVRAAQPVSFTIDAFPGRSFEGRVNQIRKAAVSSQNVVTYTVVVGFSNPGSTLLPGMTANVRIVTDTRDNALKVPNAALRVRIAGVEPAAADAPAAGASGARTGAAGGWSWLPSAHAQGAAGGGPGALRDRLVTGLDLDAAQQTQLDALLAELRPRFTALREMAETERAAAREKIQAEMRERIGKMLTPAQRERYAQMQQQAQPGRAAASPAASAAVAVAGGAAPAPAPVTPAASRPRGGAGGGGPLGEFRARLATELQLTPGLLEKVDAILAEARPRFAELRNVSEEERPKARDRILADLRARVADQLAPEQKQRYQQLVAETAGRQATRGRIYLLGTDNKPVAYNVRLGISDGVSTELLVGPNAPGADALKEGATVVIGVSGANTPAAGPQRSGPRAMF